MFSILSRRCPLLVTLFVLFCLLPMLISDSRLDLVWFRLSCDHGWIRSGSVNVKKTATTTTTHYWYEVGMLKVPPAYMQHVESTPLDGYRSFVQCSIYCVLWIINALRKQYWRHSLRMHISLIFQLRLASKQNCTFLSGACKKCIFGTARKCPGSVVESAVCGGASELDIAGTGVIVYTR